MEWHSWLSKSALDPALVHDYALLFAGNELEEDDIAHLDHDFLRSMGISIAKHRLEILKLARSHNRPPPLSRLLAAAIGRAGKRIARYVKSLRLARRDADTSAIVLLPQRPPGEAVTAAKRRNKKVKKKAKTTTAKRPVVNVRQGLLLTDGGSGGKVAASSPIKLLSGGDGGAGEQIRWDSLFQDLKPT